MGDDFPTSQNQAKPVGLAGLPIPAPLKIMINEIKYYISKLNTPEIFLNRSKYAKTISVQRHCLGLSKSLRGRTWHTTNLWHDSREGAKIMISEIKYKIPELNLES